ncbi:FecR domain-containing protein [Reichenbachiella sp. MALMAid0571]|uniref:FecR family protein n=1 Tax=Reichenbachiella sp. MALMAid0571 TaxID=3143939 RepID=UPI0032DFBB14
MEYYISKLIYKSLSGELTKNEQEEFDSWMSEKENKKFYQEIINSNSIDQKVKLYDSFDSQKAYSKLDLGNPVDRSKTIKVDFTKIMRYAAVAIIAIGLGYTSYKLTQQPQEEVVEMATLEKSNPNGRKSTFELPDGTRVNLNSASKLRYIDDTEKNRRIVQLEGEAFFDVAKDASKPFIVQSGSISTKAIGTSFNVKSYPNEKEYKVILLTGKVEVSKKGVSDGGDRVYLSPGFGVSYSTETRNLVKYNYDEEMELAWKNSILYFDESNIDEVIKLLERWYGVEIIIENKAKVKQWKYSSKFENESLENVLKGISYIQEFTFKIDNKNVTLIF